MFSASVLCFDCVDRHEHQNGWMILWSITYYVSMIVRSFPCDLVIFRWRIVWTASQQRGLVYALGDLSGGWKQVIKIDIIFQWRYLKFDWDHTQTGESVIYLYFGWEKKNYTLVCSSWVLMPITHHPLGHFNPAVTAAVAPWPLIIWFWRCLFPPFKPQGQKRLRL